MHNELRYQAKIHAVSEKLSKKKKYLHLLSHFFFLKKNASTVKKQNKSIMCGKITKTEKQPPDVLLCQPQVVPAEVSQESTRVQRE